MLIDKANNDTHRHATAVMTMTNALLSPLDGIVKALFTFDCSRQIYGLLFLRLFEFTGNLNHVCLQIGEGGYPGIYCVVKLHMFR